MSSRGACDEGSRDGSERVFPSRDSSLWLPQDDNRRGRALLTHYAHYASLPPRQQIQLPPILVIRPLPCQPPRCRELRLGGLAARKVDKRDRTRALRQLLRLCDLVRDPAEVD